MEVISHRGYWKSSNEKNARVAFERSFSLGFGTETDIRDWNGELVISHDPCYGGCYLFSDFLSLVDSINPELPLALNIKSDGLAELINDEIKKFEKLSNYCFFDMSVPDTVAYLKQGMPVLTRRSEYEHSSILEEKTEGVWLDCFESLWYDSRLLNELSSLHKKVFIVSEELHGRDSLFQWAQLKKWNAHKLDCLYLCTDYPERCRSYFRNED